MSERSYHGATYDSENHKLAAKQPHESILILLRYRTSGHNARIFYCMGETAIVYIACVILLTPRKPRRCGGHTPNEHELYVKIKSKLLFKKQKNYFLFFIFLKIYLFFFLPPQKSMRHLCLQKYMWRTDSVIAPKKCTHTTKNTAYYRRAVGSSWKLSLCQISTLLLG